MSTERKKALEDARRALAEVYESGAPKHSWIQGRTPEEIVNMLEKLTRWANALRDDIRKWPDGMPESNLDQVTFTATVSNEAAEKAIAEAEAKGMTSRKMVDLLITLLLQQRDIRKEGDRYFVNQ